ncbi:MAG: hypothetical protein IT236_12460 [Bacteroidia bacterium]|nr:hypothetical protein [Bacteroidia bacterium]
MKIKKIVAFVAVGLTLNTALAQDLTSKNGELILPQAKNWSIGLDATKFIKNVNFDFTGNAQAITGKYFKDANTAHRFGLRIGINSWNTKSFVDDRAAVQSSVVAYPQALQSTENKWQRSATSIGLSYGMEKRRGTGRLQGIYGAEAGIYISSYSDKFTYGNKLNPLSTSAKVVVDSIGDAMSSPVFGKANNVDVNPKIQGVDGFARMTVRKSGVALSIGTRAFIGAEYFVLPKLSVGGEFGWTLMFSSTGRSETTWESAGKSQNTGTTSSTTVKTTIVDGGQTNSFKLDTDNASVLGGASASLRINLYF